MTTPWTYALDIAQVLSGAAAAVAIGFSVREIVAKKREVANGVSAWAVTEGLDLDGDDSPGGVIVANPTSVALRDVRVKTQKRDDARQLTSDSILGQQFSLIPPGTYYLQQVAERTGDGRSQWSAPMPVDTGAGQYIVTPPGVAPDKAEGEDMAPGPVSLIPVASTPEHKRVAFLQFTLGDATWHRNESTELKKKAGPPTWEGEFAKSLDLDLTPGTRQKHDHSPDSGVVDFYRAFYTWLTGEQPAVAGKSRGTPRSEFRDVLDEVRLTAKQQALELDLVSDQVDTGWFAGNGKGDIATQFAIPWKSLTRQRSVRDNDGKPFTRPASSVSGERAQRESFFVELVEAIRSYVAAGPLA